MLHSSILFFSMIENEKFKTITTIVVGFLALFLLFHSRVFLYVAVIIGIGSLFFPFFGNWTVFLWTKLATMLGWINSRILLSVIFFILLFPIALLYRLFNKNHLDLKNKKDSLYLDRSHNYKKEDLENVW